MTSLAAHFYVPPFITITLVSDKGPANQYVVTNEATGRYFRANLASVQLLEAMRTTHSIALSIQRVGLTPEVAKAVLDQFIRFGIIVERGRTQDAAAPKAPIESKAVSMRFDMLNAARVTRRWQWLGYAAFTRAGLFIWVMLMIAMGFFLITNGDKAAYALRQVPQSGLIDILRFAALVVGLKIIHEMGHALAYRVMCLREGHDPGPIRMGISIFAMTPFPFTDVTGAWRLKSKWRRAAIGAGGVYFELGATAILTIFWALTNAESLQVTIFQVAIFTAATSVFFNFNPMIKLDGYYVLSDLLGQYNIQGRASMSARRWFSRRLGAATPAPEPAYLTYWVMSYLYRWTIFGGIFWIAYSVDNRLAAPVLVIIALMLIVRPLLASVQFARQQGVKPMHATVMGLGAAALIAAAFVPFQDRLLLDGRAVQHDTRYVYAVEPAQLSLSDTAVTLHNDELDGQVADLQIRRAILDNTVRAVSGSQAEQARLAADQISLAQMQDTLQRRVDLLDIQTDERAVWHPLLASQYDGSWVQSQSNAPLGSLSAPTPWKVLIWLDEVLLEQDVFARDEMVFAVRLVQDPACTFEAKITQSLTGVAATEKSFDLTGIPLGPTPECLTKYDQGAAVVARIPTRDKSVFDRSKRLILRLLQNRSPLQEQT